MALEYDNWSNDGMGLPRVPRGFTLTHQRHTLGGAAGITL